MQVTAHFVVWTIVLQVLLGFGLALLINQKFRGHGFWTTVILLPMMLSRRLSAISGRSCSSRRLDCSTTSSRFSPGSTLTRFRCSAM
jgi:ABC-type sugar transport system permease subunit